MDQKTARRSIAVGPGFESVSPVAYWLKHGQFDNEDEAKGAFKLAYQQAMDGMGTSIAAWMGLTEEQLADWVRNDTLPKH